LSFPKLINKTAFLNELASSPAGLAINLSTRSFLWRINDIDRCVSGIGPVDGAADHADVARQVDDWFNQIAASDDAKKFLSNLGSDPLLGSAELVDKMIAKETQEWSEYVRIAKIEPQ
jgi:hypothetical protein